MPDQSNLVEVDHLSKMYGGKPAIDDLSFSLKQGRILGLVGPNGAGKTTTLRILAGIIKQNGGRILVDGLDTAEQSLQAKRIIGYVPDEPNLFESLTVWEHIEFTASVYGLESYVDSAIELLDRFNLLGNRDSAVQELSLGMRQKLAISCVYLSRPKVLLFDEPLTGLDPMGIHEMSRSIRHFSENGGSVIISSHLLGLVEEICSDVLLLHNGQELLSGPLDEVLNNISSNSLEQKDSLESVFFRAVGANIDTDLT